MLATGRDAWLVTYRDTTIGARICIWVPGGYGGSNTLRACGLLPAKNRTRAPAQP